MFVTWYPDLCLLQVIYKTLFLQWGTVHMKSVWHYLPLVASQRAIQPWLLNLVACLKRYCNSWQQSFFSLSGVCTLANHDQHITTGLGPFFITSKQDFIHIVTNGIQHSVLLVGQYRFLTFSIIFCFLLCDCVRTHLSQWVEVRLEYFCSWYCMGKYIVVIHIYGTWFWIARAVSDVYPDTKPAAKWNIMLYWNIHLIWHAGDKAGFSVR